MPIKDFKISHFLYPISIWKIRKFLEKTEYYSHDALLQYQYNRLKHIIEYSYSNVKYYRKLFDNMSLRPNDIKTIDDLQYIPVLTKEIVRNNFDELISDEAHKFKPLLTHTSGSTGTPLKLYLDKNINAARFAFFWRIWNWTGYKLGYRWASIRGSIFDDGSIYKYSRFMNAIYISSFNLTEETSIQILNELVRFKPSMLRGYPSSLYEFGKFIENRKELYKLSLNNIVTDSETLLDHQRDFIQKVFNCRVFDCYSHWEHICMIAECENQIKHHQMEYGILELLDKDNKIVIDNKIGEITATGFYNHVMPLIRYKTRDFATVNKNILCECGRKHDIIESIDGRIEDIILTPDGRRVGRIDAAFKYNKGFDYAQIIQNNIDSIDVYLVKNKYYSIYEDKILIEQLQKRLGNSIKINIKFVPRILSQKSGKIRFVISNIGDSYEG